MFHLHYLLAFVTSFPFSFPSNIIILFKENLRLMAFFSHCDCLSSSKVNFTVKTERRTSYTWKSQIWKKDNAPILSHPFDCWIDIVGLLFKRQRNATSYFYLLYSMRPINKHEVVFFRSYFVLFYFILFVCFFFLSLLSAVDQLII